MLQFNKINSQNREIHLFVLWQIVFGVNIKPDMIEIGGSPKLEDSKRLRENAAAAISNTENLEEERLGLFPTSHKSEAKSAQRCSRSPQRIFVLFVPNYIDPQLLL